MKDFITIKASKPSQTEKMIYEDEKGNSYSGPSYPVIIGKTYCVEVTGRSTKDGSYQIIKFISMVGQ